MGVVVRVLLSLGLAGLVVWVNLDGSPVEGQRNLERIDWGR